MSYEVRLDVFEGPFEVLLTLIGDRRLDVCDIPIARLTEDYLSHIGRMADLDLEVTTEFLVVATTLLQLKARALLPVPADDGSEAEEDTERDLLIARLLEVRTFQSVGALLWELLAEGDRRFPGAPARDDPGLRRLPTLAGIEARDLATALVEILRDAVRSVDLSLLVGDQVSMEEAGSEIMSRLASGSLTFRELTGGRGLSWAVALFLAMLELSMRGEVRLGQGERLGDVEITLLAEPTERVP